MSDSPSPVRASAHFHSAACYAMGPGDTEILICKVGEHVKAEVGPMPDAESRSGVQALASSGSPASPIVSEHDTWPWTLPEVRQLVRQGRTKHMGESEIPRRARMDQWTPAEKAIQAAIDVVESMPADGRLTDAVIFLGKARERVADYVDGE